MLLARQLAARPRLQKWIPGIKNHKEDGQAEYVISVLGSPSHVSLSQTETPQVGCSLPRHKSVLMKPFPF